jgi:RNA polymerase sigma factor (sigma-70 family)
MGDSEMFRQLILKFNARDAGALNELLGLLYERLERLTRKMLGRRLERWEGSQDILQEACLKISRHLEAGPQIKSVTHFINVMGKRIGRTLSDMARHYFGPEGIATHHHTTLHPPGHGSAHDPARSPGPAIDGLAWAEFWDTIDTWSEEDKTLVNLRYCVGFTETEVAALLNLTVDQVKHRMRRIRRKVGGLLRTLGLHA